MAQVLKEELRGRIIESAKQELLEKGYKGVSMRKIAQGADMTVGNLYRYFENKDDLINQIIEPAMRAIDAVLMEESSHMVSLFDAPHVRIVEDIPVEELKKRATMVIKNLAYRLDDLLVRHYDEIMILTENENDINQKFTDWLKCIVKICVPHFHKTHCQSPEEQELLSDIIGESALTGIKYIFRNRENLPEGMGLGQAMMMYVKTLLQL